MRLSLERLAVALFAALSISGCQQALRQSESANDDLLVGAWRAKIHFSTGAFAAINDLEFMYVFNAGGTMMESSNYDASPPVPPAYGIWRQTGAREFEAKYEFYSTAARYNSGDSGAIVGWLPSGRGVLVETIVVADDGKSFTSQIRYDAFDASGAPVEGGGMATGEGIKLEF